MIKTGGNFDPLDKHIYFNASSMFTVLGYRQHVHRYVLIAIDELQNTNLDKLVEIIDKQKKVVLIDSGIFNLTMEHVRRTGMSHAQALSLEPDKINGFDALWNKYTAVVKALGDRCWGYIELDQGGRESKTKIRTRLESMGLKPIPVYHPFADGWDYFDYLAENYDRVCIGNLSQSETPVRLRLVSTIYDRMQKYPGLWVHLLGLSPNEWLNAFPVHSADSSSWISSAKWSGAIERTNCKAVGPLMRNFQYKLGDRRGREKGLALSAYMTNINQRNWRNYLLDLELE